MCPVLLQNAPTSRLCALRLATYMELILGAKIVKKNSSNSLTSVPSSAVGAYSLTVLSVLAAFSPKSHSALVLWSRFSAHWFLLHRLTLYFPLNVLKT